MKRFRLWVSLFVAFVTVGAVVVLFSLDAQAVKTTSKPLPLAKTFDKSPTGFSFQYPQEWDYIIPAVGILLAGHPATLHEGVAGPTFAVQRLQPLSVVGSLDEALAGYLNNGPLRVAGRWQITQAVSAVSLDEREALQVHLEGSDRDDGPQLAVHIVIASADNTFVYLFVTTVPLDQRATYDPTFANMLASVRILE